MEKRIRNLIRTLTLEILDELKEEDLEEATTTGDVQGYMTPMAFTGGKGKKKKKKISTNSTGYKIVKKKLDI